MIQKERDRKNLLRRLNRKKAKASLQLKCLHCGKDIPLEKRSWKFCSDQCKINYHSNLQTERFKREGYPDISRTRRDKLNAEKRRIRRELYLGAEHKCKQCGILLTLEYYPKTEFCSRKCSIKHCSRNHDKRKLAEITLKEKPKEKITIRIDAKTWIEVSKGDELSANEFIKKHKQRKQEELDNLKKIYKYKRVPQESQKAQEEIVEKDLLLALEN